MFQEEANQDEEDDEELAQARQSFLQHKQRPTPAGPVKYWLKRVRFLHDYFLHRMMRCPFTGDFYIKGVDELYDFTYVDLFDRDKVLGTCDDIVNDRYLFRPVPLLQRTWAYHSMYSGENSWFLMEFYQIRMGISGGAWPPPPKKNRRDFILKALRTPGLDLKGSSYGRGSPFLTFVPIAIFGLGVRDWYITLYTIILFGFLIVSCRALNNYALSWVPRFASLPPRIYLVIWLITSMDVPFWAMEGHYLRIFCTACMLVLSFYEFISGDFVYFLGNMMLTRFEILKVLPGRVMVCSKVQGSTWMSNFNRVGEI
jgi:hypothetical protein